MLESNKKKESERFHEYRLKMRKIAALGNIEEKLVIRYIIDSLKIRNELKYQMYTATNYKEFAKNTKYSKWWTLTEICTINLMIVQLIWKINLKNLYIAIIVVLRSTNGVNLKVCGNVLIPINSGILLKIEIKQKILKEIYNLWLIRRVVKLFLLITFK